MTKLTQADVDLIITRRAVGDTLKSIADDYGISVGYVSQICTMRAGLAGIVGETAPPIPAGYRRLASGKVIKYTPTHEWLAEQRGYIDERARIGTKPKGRR